MKQIRSSTGLSQRSFAESIGICQSAVGYYESGKHRVSDVIWEKIKSVYHDVIVQLAIPEEIPELSKKELPPEAETLRQIRCASGLSQREFAESIGVSKSTIGNCEIGMQEISDQIWARIKEKYPHQSDDDDGQGDELDDDQDDVRDDDQLKAETGHLRSSSSRKTDAKSTRRRSSPGSEKLTASTSVSITTPRTGSGARRRERWNCGEHNQAGP